MSYSRVFQGCLNSRPPEKRGGPFCGGVRGYPAIPGEFREVGEICGADVAEICRNNGERGRLWLETGWGGNRGACWSRGLGVWRIAEMGGHGAILAREVADTIEQSGDVIDVPMAPATEAFDMGIVGAVIVKVGACGAWGIAIIVGGVGAAEIAGSSGWDDAASAEVLAEEGFVVGNI